MSFTCVSFSAPPLLVLTCAPWPQCINSPYLTVCLLFSVWGCLVRFLRAPLCCWVHIGYAMCSCENFLLYPPCLFSVCLLIWFCSFLTFLDILTLVFVYSWKSILSAKTREVCICVLPPHSLCDNMSILYIIKNFCDKKCCKLLYLAQLCKLFHISMARILLFCAIFLLHAFF